MMDEALQLLTILTFLRVVAGMVDVLNHGSEIRDDVKELILPRQTLLKGRREILEDHLCGERRLGKMPMIWYSSKGLTYLCLLFPWHHNNRLAGFSHEHILSENIEEIRKVEVAR